MSALFAPGFFGSEPVHIALVIGGISALGCGVVGTFTVLRGQSYAGPALADPSVTILFGSMFTISPGLVPVVAAFGLPALFIVAVLFRPLVLSSVSPELAAARGVRVRLTGLACLIAIALAVSLAAISIGAILSTALLVGPAAIALRLTRS